MGATLAGQNTSKGGHNLTGSVTSGGAVLKQGMNGHNEAIRIEESSPAGGRGSAAAAGSDKLTRKKISLKKVNIQQRLEPSNRAGLYTAGEGEEEKNFEGEQGSVERKKSVSRMAMAKEQAMRISRQGVDNAII